MNDAPLATILIGTVITQGTLVKQWRDHRGNDRATVSDGDRIYTGYLVTDGKDR